MLNLVARDQAATDRWAVAGATYQGAVDLARESGPQPNWPLAWPGLPGCRRAGGGNRSTGRVPPKRSAAAVSSEQGCTRSRQRRRWRAGARPRRCGQGRRAFRASAATAARCAITDAVCRGGRARRRLRPARPERPGPAGTAGYLAAASAKNQPWPLAPRCAPGAARPGDRLLRVLRAGVAPDAQAPACSKRPARG